MKNFGSKDLGQNPVNTTGMTFKEYGDCALRTMKNFDSNEIKRMDGELGLIGELGEFLDFYKKLKTHELTDENKEKVCKNLALEAGDIMWYIGASLGDSYGVTFGEIGNYLLESKKINSSNTPLLSSLDNTVTDYEFNTYWKDLVVTACKLLYAKDKEEVISHSATFLVILTAIINHELGISIEKVAHLNVEKLKSRYKNGFDSKVSNSRIELLTD